MKKLAILIVLTLLVAASAGASYRYKLKIGRGGLLLYGGNMTVKSLAGATKFTLLGASGNTAIAGTLGVTGATALNGGITVGATNFTVNGTTGAVTTASNLSVAGTSTLPFVPVVNQTIASRTISATDYGKVILCSFAGVTTVNLPAATTATIGAEFFLAQTVDQALRLVGGPIENNNALIADGVLTSDMVSFETLNRKVGAMMRVMGVSATQWLVTSACSNPMTVEPADP